MGGSVIQATGTVEFEEGMSMGFPWGRGLVYLGDNDGSLSNYFEDRKSCWPKMHNHAINKTWLFYGTWLFLAWVSLAKKL